MNLLRRIRSCKRNWSTQSKQEYSLCKSILNNQRRNKFKLLSNHRDTLSLKKTNQLLSKPNQREFWKIKMRSHNNRALLNLKIRIRTIWMRKINNTWMRLKIQCMNSSKRSNLITLYNNSSNNSNNSSNNNNSNKSNKFNSNNSNNNNLSRFLNNLP